MVPYQSSEVTMWEGYGEDELDVPPVDVATPEGLVAAAVDQSLAVAREELTPVVNQISSQMADLDRRVQQLNSVGQTAEEWSRIFAHELGEVKGTLRGNLEQTRVGFKTFATQVGHFHAGTTDQLERLSAKWDERSGHFSAQFVGVRQELDAVAQKSQTFQAELATISENVALPAKIAQEVGEKYDLVIAYLEKRRDDNDALWEQLAQTMQKVDSFESRTEQMEDGLRSTMRNVQDLVKDLQKSMETASDFYQDADTQTKKLQSQIDDLQRVVEGLRNAPPSSTSSSTSSHQDPKVLEAFGRELVDLRQKMEKNAQDMSRQGLDLAEAKERRLRDIEARVSKFGTPENMAKFSELSQRLINLEKMD